MTRIIVDHDPDHKVCIRVLRALPEGGPGQPLPVMEFVKAVFRFRDPEPVHPVATSSAALSGG
jgi:hypothetical protein